MSNLQRRTNAAYGIERWLSSKGYKVTNKTTADMTAAFLKSKGLEYEQVLMADDFISKKDILNTKNKLSFQRINEELNIYYVAATRAKNVIQLADLNLSYTYNENEETTSYVKSRFTNKQTHNKKV